MESVRFVGAIQNLGWFDRALRFVLGLFLIIAAVIDLESSQDGGVYAYLMIFAIYPTMSAVLGWDPIYHLMQIKSCNPYGRNRCGTFPFEIAAVFGRKLKCDENDCSLAGNRNANRSHHP